MKLSNKDILLVFGIIVAIVVTLTTMAYSEQHSYLPKASPSPKVGVDRTAAELIRKTLQRVAGYHDQGE